MQNHRTVNGWRLDRNPDRDDWKYDFGPYRIAFVRLSLINRRKFTTVISRKREGHFTPETLLTDEWKGTLSYNVARTREWLEAQGALCGFCGRGASRELAEHLFRCMECGWKWSTEPGNEYGLRECVNASS